MPKFKIIPPAPPPLDMPKYPNRLHSLRMRYAPIFYLTQKEVAKLIGVDYTTVSAHESGNRRLAEEHIIAYSRLYKVQSYEIFTSKVEFKRV